MRAYLLVDHGSRLEEANAIVQDVARELAAQLDAVVAFAHQETAAPSIEEALDALVTAGARELIVIPFFLAPGRHATSDVPRLAREAAARHHGLTVHVTAPPLPARPARLATLVREALEETR